MLCWKTVVVVLLAAWSVNGECQCGVFLTNSQDTTIEEVYLGSVYPQACERLEVDQVCRDFCYQTFSNLTSDGHLEAVSPVFNASSAEVFCKNVHQDVTNREVAGYYRWCQLSWKFVGIRAQGKICCRNGTFVRCQEPEEHPETTPSVSVVEQVLATEVSKLEDGSSSEQEQGRKASDQSTVDDEGASNNTLPDTRFKRSFDEAVNETTEDEHSVNTTEYSSSYQSEQDPKGRAFDAQTQALDESTTTDDASEIEYATRHHGQQQLLHVVRRSPQVTLEDSGSTWETVQATEEEFGGRAADVTTLEPLSERADDSTGTEELPSGRHESVSEPVAEVLKEDEIRSVNVTDDDHQNVTCRRSHGHPENSVTAEPSDPDNTTDDHVARFVVDITETVEVSARNAVTEEEVTDGHYLHLQAWNSSLEQESSDDN